MDIRKHLLSGGVIPALPLALDSNRRLSEKHQRALVRYYISAGCSGLAVAVHSTQFEIREPQHGLLQPVLELAAQTMNEHQKPFARIAGVCGRTEQAVAEAELARSLGYHALLVSVAAWKNDEESAILDHYRRVAEVLPVIGFYLQPSVGGRTLSYRFWKEFAEIENAVAIKVAPFNRFKTNDVMRAVAESGREDLALYTGNDDNIVIDLLTPFRFRHKGQIIERRMHGGLLGHWGVWSHAAVQLYEKICVARDSETLDTEWLATAAAVTDMNAAVFDAANGFAGCIPGILEVLRRQGLVPTSLCLNPHETLSPGQAEELDRVTAANPDLVDNAFVQQHLHEWLR